MTRTTSRGNCATIAHAESELTECKASVMGTKSYALDLRARPQPDILVEGRGARRASWGLKILLAGPSDEAAAGFYRDLPTGNKLD